MPFTYKLSRRLALIYAAVPLGAAVSGCQIDHFPIAPTSLVASVEISPSNLTLPVGESERLTAIMRDAKGGVLTDRAVTWASNDTLVVRLDPTGVLSARAAGGAAVTATSEGISGTASVNVPPPPVASVEVSPVAATLLVGDSQPFTTTLRDSSGNVLTGRAISWSSNDSTVVSVGPWRVRCRRDRRR